MLRVFCAKTTLSILDPYKMLAAAEHRAPGMAMVDWVLPPRLGQEARCVLQTSCS